METKALKITRSGYVFVWHGGEYIEILAEGHTGARDFAIEVINVSNPDGSLPDFHKANLLAQVRDWQDKANAEGPGPRGWKAQLDHTRRETLGY